MGDLALEVLHPQRDPAREDLRLDQARPHAARDGDQAQPGKRYWYRFAYGRRLSRTGTFVTAPAAASTKTVRFAWSGDTDAQPLKGQTEPFYNSQGNKSFGAYGAMAAEHNDFNVNIGDTIYSDSEVGADTSGGVFRGSALAFTLAEKWAKYRQNLALAKLQRLRRSAGLYSTPDDHEWVNDYGPGQTLIGTDKQGKPIDVKASSIYPQGVAAFRDYAPVRYSKKTGFYRSFRWGKNLEVFILDERSFRSKPAGTPKIHTCDNPDTGQPDLAPTLPQSRRDVYGALVTSLRRPVSKQCLDTIRSSKRTMLGAAQRKKFLAAVKGSKATFKVIMNPVNIQQFYAFPYDRWEGYESERRLLLHQLQDHVKNSIFLTTDIHASLVNTAKYQTFEPGGVKDSGIFDVSTGPVATRTYQREIAATLGEDQEAAPTAKTIDSAIFTPALPTGLGMQCAEINTFSYGQVTATRTKLTVQLKDLDGKPLVDQLPTPKTCAPIVLKAK